MKLGAAFDSSYVCKDPLKSHIPAFHNLELTHHTKRLEDDYDLLRDHGFTLFRDSAHLTKTFSQGVINWDYLDRLAKFSKGQIQLTISHYEFIEPDAAFHFAYKLAHRYPDVFHSYIPVCESGFWAVKLTEDWLPHYPTWWSAYKAISEITCSIAKGLKRADPYCKIAMAEPWYWSDNFDDRARPYNTLLGKMDTVAEANDCNTHLQGRYNLLDIIGLNIYGHHDIKGLIQKAQDMFPYKEIMITETSNIWYQHVAPEEWIAMLEDQTYCTMVEDVVWSPALQMFGFEHGDPVGGYLYDLQRNSAMQAIK